MGEVAAARGAHARCTARNDVRGVLRARDVAWRRVSGPFWCAEEASEETVVGWATAESSGTGCVLTTTG